MTSGRQEEALWRFMAKTDRSGECWLWTAGTNSLGYPTFSPESGRKEYAGRWMSEILGEALHEGRVSMLCGSIRCVRPSHIIVTRTNDTFWGRVVEDASGCWIWTGRRQVKGYGRHPDGTLAHRYAYQEMFGPIPDDLVLDHMCETPACVNPWHLDPVPQSVNIARTHTRPDAVRVGVN